MVNVVIYARYSTEKQTEQSIEGQIRDCRAFAVREKYNVICEYIDRAVSGKTDDRTEFQRMIDDSDKRRFQAVISIKPCAANLYVQNRSYYRRCSFLRRI